MSGEIISDLENAILSPLHSRQKFDPDYFNKERKFIEKYHRDFERLFIYIDSMSTFSEESDKDLITFLSEDLYSSLFHTMRSKKADCIIENFIKKYSDLTRTIIVNL
jgi:hypothetical protein